MHDLTKEPWVNYNYEDWLAHFKENDQARLQLDFSEEPVLLFHALFKATAKQLFCYSDSDIFVFHIYAPIKSACFSKAKYTHFPNLLISQHIPHIC